MKGFTIIEMLIVVAILAVMGTALVGSLRRGTTSAADFDVVVWQLVDEFRQAQTATVTATAPRGLTITVESYEVGLLPSGYTAAIYDGTGQRHDLRRVTWPDYATPRPCTFLFTTGRPSVTTTDCQDLVSPTGVVALPVRQLSTDRLRTIEVHTQTGWTAALGL